MAEPLSAIFRRPFAEQVAAFRLRLGNLVSTSAWDDLWQEQHDRAFMVAGAAKADLLADLAAAVDKAIVQGTTLEEFRRDFRAIVETRGWHGWTGEGSRRGEAWRTRVIYRTNMSTSYMAGRYAQLTAAGYKYWIYRHSGAEHPRLDHLSWDGVALPPDHPFWVQHYPPNGWGCGCKVYGADSEDGIRRKGGVPGKRPPEGWDQTDPKTGAEVGIGRGWGYAPGATAVQDILALTDKLPGLPAPIGSAFAAAWPPAAVETLMDRFQRFVDEALSGPPRGRHIVVGSLKPAWVDAARSHKVSPESAEIAVRDQDIWHTFRDAKAAKVDLAWYRSLPGNLDSPQTVLLDLSHQDQPSLLLVYQAQDSLTKLVVRINYRLKKSGTMNVIQTGRNISLRDLKGLIGNGAIIIDGDL